MPRIENGADIATYLCLRLSDAQVTLAVTPDNGRRGALVPRFDNPTVLVTRPMAASERFVDVLRSRTDRFTPLIAPAFEIVSTGRSVPEFGAAIFTSRAGVDHAPTGAGRVAYCVGAATADAARAAGYDAVSADGAAEDLIRLILSLAPTQSLLHIRGEVSRGNVSERLNAAGLNCTDVIAYRKAPVPLAPGIKTQIKQAETLLIPLFSAETVSILAQWGVDLTASHVIAISPFVAGSAKQLSPAGLSIAAHPDQGSMVDRIMALIA